MGRGARPATQLPVELRPVNVYTPNTLSNLKQPIMLSSSTICASCLRAARRGVNNSVAETARTVRPTTRAYSRATSAATWRPIHPEFLAPSAIKADSRAISAFNPRAPLRTKSQHASRRTLATTSDPSSAKPAHAIQNPRTDDSGNPMLISISPRASNRLYSISTKDNNPNLALRVTIESGGCHGFQYLMDLTDLSKKPATEEDTIFEGDKGEKIIIDEPSLELLNGSTVDYTMELIGSQFKVTGIPGATSSCGCGTSFDIKL
ncbi:[4Fe-4S] proteins maturation [Neocucurbitaria cava]|uniref:[4Fe-4S] proteins maturation n=1 Tax=Neocucurbitaria cava TaxID=798079 RepID=A0A9W8YG87_9PLEO|nr:[4Fe-4S] proteins maturation [Neocucurbitaria cava]